MSKILIYLNFKKILIYFLDKKTQPNQVWTGSTRSIAR